MKKIILLMLCLIFYISCGKSDNPFEKIKDNYKNTILILNEGNREFNNFNVDATNNTFTDLKSSIYDNSDSPENSISKSIAFFNDKAFIVISNQNRIEVVDRYSFDHIETITDQIEEPLYIAFSSDKAYITSAKKNSITIYDADDFQYLSEIDIKGESEHIISENNKVYVQKKGNSLSIDNEIVVINTDTDEIISNIKVQDNIQGMVSNSGFIYVISSINTRTNYYRINTDDDKIFTEFTSTKVVDGKKLCIDRNVIYYVSNNNIHSWEFSAKKVDPNPILSIKKEKDSGFLNGFGVINGNIFTANALDFKSKSDVTVYDIKGNKITEFKTGIGTNNFYKN